MQTKQQFMAGGKVKDFNVKVFPPELGYGEFSNYMMFETYTQKGGVGQSTSDINFAGPHGSICLPIPSGIGTTYEQGWEQEDVGKAGSAAGMVGEIMKGEKGFMETGGEVLDTGRTAMGGEGAIMSGVGKMIGQNAAGQRAGGTALFSNTYMTYSGPAFRDFTYNFNLFMLF